MWLLATIGAILLKLILDEVLEWCPWVAERLIVHAARRLPADSQDRYRDEWLAELQALRGKGLSKLIFAVHILLGARGVREALGEIRLGRPTVFLVRLADISLSAISLFVMAPTIACITLAIRILDPGPAFIRVAYVRDGEIVHSQLYFRTFSLPQGSNGAAFSQSLPDESSLGQWLRMTGLYAMPALVDVIRGGMSFVGPVTYGRSWLESGKPGHPEWRSRSPFELWEEADRPLPDAADLQWVISWKTRNPLRAFVPRRRSESDE